MTNFTGLSALIAGTALLTLAACSTATPAKDHKANMQQKHQMMAKDHMNQEHTDMMGQMKMDHDMMSKMDMSKMDVSKLSAECQTMMTKMKTKMADKHKDGGMHAKHKDGNMHAQHKDDSMHTEKHAGMKDHDMSKMADHDKPMMQGHDAEKMKSKMAKHKKCMAEMKEAMPHEH